MFHIKLTNSRQRVVSVWYSYVANLPPPPAFMLDSTVSLQHGLILFQFNLLKHREAPALMRNLQAKID